MMADQEDRAVGPPQPGHEHHPAPRHEHHHTAIVAGSHSPGGETAGHDATRLAGEVIGEIAQQVSRLMTAQKNLAADGLHHLACALRHPAEPREPNDVGGQLAAFTDRTAARIESISTYMRGNDFPSILRDAGQLARRRPEVLLAGTILTGLIVASLLKASRRSAAATWTPATGSWRTALQKGTQAVSAAAETLKQGGEARGLIRR